VEGEGEDERYISFISDVFAKFLEENEEKYRGADFEEPDYLKKPEFRLNRDLVRDRRVLKFVEEDEAFESLYKLILNSFRKLKTRASGIVTSGTLSQLNLLIQEIKDYIQRPEKEVNESQFVSFLDFKKETQPNVDYVLQEGEDSEKDENPLLSFEDFISKLETIENQTPPTDEPLVEKEDDRKINVIMGRFQPFHLGHLKMAKKLHEENKLPTFVVVVYPGHNKSGNSPFDEATIKQYMDAVVKENSDVLVDYMIVSRGLLGSAINKLVEMGFEPHLVGAGEDRQEDYEKQMDYIKRTELFEKLPEDFKLVETPRSTSATEVRKKLKDEDYAALKKMLPKSVLNLYSGLASELNKN
jgi:nicotinamide mononucleotide adenylyltransferase